MALAINILGSVLGIFLSLAPLPWYGKVHNLPNIILAFWLFFMNIFLFANAITWGGNTNIHSLEYCDLATKLLIGFLFALPTSSLLTSIQHYVISNICELDMGKRIYNWKLIEGLTSAAVPLIFMLLHLVVQDHRFDIIEGYGCMPSVFPSYAAIFLIWIPLMLLGGAALVVNLIIFKHMLHCPSHFTLEAHLHWKESQYSTKHIVREFAMTTIHAALSLTLAITAMAFYGHDGVHPFPSLAVVHENSHTVFTFTSEALEHGLPNGLGSPVFVWWLVPVATFVFAATNLGDAERAACVRFYYWLAYAPPKRKWETIRNSVPFFAPPPPRDFDDYDMKYVEESEMRRRAKRAELQKLESQIRGQARMRSSRLAEIKESKAKKGKKSRISQQHIDAELTNFPSGYSAWKRNTLERVRERDPTLQRTQQLRRKREQQLRMQEMAGQKADERMNASINLNKPLPTTYPPGFEYGDDYKVTRLELDVDSKLRPLPTAYVRK
ncbi:hypothetical protein SCHPADRAFT_937868 [Schizopora paradoxa]|uniref:STE3-domain-containing protein n=1 Tax=Schizopora paradoxa TaxID=27342 RepID=A0A0H2SHK0_9AGAM|nr:hypothetical protein SCHPADRAFT_937868 [Schizopora paradoxa]